MKCPVCKTTTLRDAELEHHLHTFSCETYTGAWVRFKDYEQWLTKHQNGLPPQPEESTPIEVSETLEAKLCPDCKHILIKYKVGHGMDFHLNRCASCGGIWFEKNEWEALKSKNLHEEIHIIFGAEWQQQAIKEKSNDFLKEHRNKKLLEILTEEELHKVQDFQDWLSKHPKKEEIEIYLRTIKI